MSASLSATQTGGQWIPAAAAEQQFLAAGTDMLLCDWLAEGGLLTRRLSAACPDNFRLEVLRDAEEQRLEDGDMQREVLLCCGDQACVYASTLVPHATLAAHPWLGKLGNDPLGETLQGRADISRSHFEYRLFDAELLPPAIAGAQNDPVWARRSDFRISGLSLTVTEWFLTALITCDKQRIRIVSQAR